MGFFDDEVVSKVEQQQSYEPVPEGSYRVILTDAEVKATKKGGHYVNARFELTGNADHDGRVVFEKFNVDNDNSQAVVIGLQGIKEFSSAVGKADYYESLKLSESWADASSRLSGMFDALGNIPLEIKIAVKKDDQYGDHNVIKRYKKAKASTAAAPVTKRPW